MGADIPPVPPLVAFEQDMDMQSVVQLLTQLVASQAQCHTPGTSDRAINMRVQDFINLNSPVFTETNPNTDPQNVLDHMQQTLRVMHATDAKIL